MNQNSNPLAVQYFNVQSNNFDGVGPAFVLDNVSVQAVPEPSGYAMQALLALGGAGLLFLKRRRA